MDIGTATDVGRVRAGNEDALLAVRPDGARQGQVVVAVADGMGGHKAGEVASALAISGLQRALTEVDPALSADSLLAYAAEIGNRMIFQASAADPEKEGMGTTLVCAVVDAEGQTVVGNVGDSRAYGYTATSGETVLITIDHTWVNQQVLAGEMSEREARFSPFRNLLTRTLGNAPRVEVDVFKGFQLQDPGDALILVSDGVTCYLDESDFSAVLSSVESAQEAASRLVEESVRRGGADNATAVVVRRR
jgi:serine/threonine protein phosphatase PrpC